MLLLRLGNDGVLGRRIGMEKSEGEGSMIWKGRWCCV
jgi:hypothetical protein